jgi:hypothetical protein
VTVGPLPKVTSNMLQYLLHIHRTIPPVLGVFCADLSIRMLRSILIASHRIKQGGAEDAWEKRIEGHYSTQETT